jgi:serine/threonine-protein kinase OSR1/STK39
VPLKTNGSYLGAFLVFTSHLLPFYTISGSSNNPLDYTIGPIIGFGASSVVYSASFRPSSLSSNPIPCALKVLNLDLLPPSALRLLQRETTLMSLSKHPNVLRVRGTWIDGHHLHIAMRLMNKGSAADVMRYGWPGGMEEEVIKCILKQTLEGLKSVHFLFFLRRFNFSQLSSYKWIHSPRCESC